MNLLVTGGAGFIGGNCAVELINEGHNVTILDNLTNGSLANVNMISRITGIKPDFFECDVRDENKVESILRSKDIDAVLHFAGLKSVSESVMSPLLYFKNNIEGGLSLLSAMKSAGVYHLIFSSSATVYKSGQKMPLSESSITTDNNNPYGKSKYIFEKILEDLCASDNRWSIGALRYFNPVGAHKSGLLGDNPSGSPSNLMPYICRVATGQYENLKIYGSDYPTTDGTGVRDFIHVQDLAEGHVAALKYMMSSVGYNVWNLGTGTGCSVLMLVKMFMDVTGESVPYILAPRRAGDVAESWASAVKAERELGWSATHGLDKMISDSWHFAHKNN